MKKTYRGYVRFDTKLLLRATSKCPTKVVAIQKTRYIAKKDPRITWIGVYLVVDNEKNKLVYEEKV